MRTQTMEATDLLEQLEKSPGAQVTITGSADAAPWSGTTGVYWEYVVGQSDGAAFSAVFDSRHGPDTIGLRFEDGTAELHVNAFRLHLKAAFDKSVETPADAKLGRMPADISAEDYPLRVVEHVLTEGQTLFAHVASVTIELPPTEPGGAPVKAEKKILHLSDAPFESGETTALLTPRSSGLSF